MAVLTREQALERLRETLTQTEAKWRGHGATIAQWETADSRDAGYADGYAQAIGFVLELLDEMAATGRRSDSVGDWLNSLRENS